LLKNYLQGFKKWFWLYCSGFLPLCFYFFILRASPITSVRAGLVGLLIALFIYLLWKISLRLHGTILPEKYSRFFITFSGVLLWAVWFSMAQVILIAFDELIYH